MDALDALSVPDAARTLGVDPSRVRALLANGQLDGQKVGGRWLVAGPSLRERDRGPHEPGRRLRPANAWAVLALASNETAPWVSKHERRRLARLLAERGLAQLVGRLGERSRVERLFAHPGVLGALQQAHDVVPAGAQAAREQGARLLSGQEADLYISERGRAALARRFALEPSDQPNVIIRVLPEGLWPFSDRRMPLAAVAVDLAELPDERARRIGRQLIGRLNVA